MMQDAKSESYQVHVWIRKISPMIWRRLLVNSDSTLADLHYAIQITFCWTDFHLHRFRLRGQDYGIPRIGGPWYSKDARQVKLGTFNFRRNERFLYEYDFGDLWKHEVRIEQRLPVESGRIYPGALAGAAQGRPKTAVGHVGLHGTPG
jgi:Plasmid pRiA4b ORF-3-like protein